jgi:glycosyltransferase involved in cell wall biosynthesis
MTPPLTVSNVKRRVLIDGRMAAEVGGGFTYLVNMVPRLTRTNPDVDFLLVLRTERLARALSPAPNLEIRQVAPRGRLGRLAYTFLDGPKLARQWGADLYFSVSEYAPSNAPCPVVASFRNPNIFTPLEQDWGFSDRLRLTTLRALARLSARSCDRIMFVSEDSARWIGDAAGVAEERRAVVHHGIDLEGWARKQARPVHPRPYILSVSTVYRYKNFVRLIEAYADLARRHPEVPDLVIAGDHQDLEYAEKMEAARRATGPLAERILFTGEVPYDQVHSWYAGASLFAFPSYLETFGHPMLEAMASGVPIVASDIEVFRELGGDAPLYVDPHSPKAFADAMEEILWRPEAARALAKRGRERVRQFTWDRSAERLSALFHEVIDGVPADAQPARRSVPSLRYTEAA